LLTGATGLVGGALLEEFKKNAGDELYGLAGEKNRNNVPDGLAERLYRADIADYQKLREAVKLKKADVLIHAAGLAHQFGRVVREDFRRVNVSGTANVCRLAAEKGVGHLILTSSVAVYGRHPNSPVDETFACQPEGFYAESKLEAEERASEICQREKIRLTILRLATVVGEGDRGNTMRLIRAIDRGRFLWIGEGKNQKSLIYKGDAARGILRALASKAGAETEIYNLTAEAVTVLEIVGAISNSLGKRPPKLRIPARLVHAILKVNKTGLRSELLKNLENTLEKWLSDDIYTGRKFTENHEFRTTTSIPEALGREVGFYLEVKKKAAADKQTRSV